VLDLIQHAEAMQKPGQELPWQQTRNQTMQLVQDLFQAGKREGAFAIDDTSLATLMLLGGLRGVLRFGERPRPADLPERIVTGFLGGYAAAGQECRPARVEKRSVGRMSGPGGLPVIEGAA